MPTSATAGSIASFLAIVIHEFLRINLGDGVGQGCRTTFNAGLLMRRNGMPRENLMHSRNSTLARPANLTALING
jgi:hypothetical protein